MDEPTTNLAESVRATIAALTEPDKSGVIRMSRELLAHVMGVTTKTVERRLAGERDFLLRELTAIADYLGIPIEELMGEKPDPEELAGEKHVRS
ncbi:helix-turn-helix transcriptional regulator [Rhodococcus sp. T2V]|uniref:helix-turn-helix domain-containing protein n=1 Tax=Rhodococcus sp. T2V TaxID=3034164 RepID=UPI0023E2116C|nr:helix-turn-helix transcriptional regulator [Rhodococcus sp. T2V]MDF3309803.1 helix-turn-helix transcriptional regulator [Rhodococcus sp. T2V]